MTAQIPFKLGEIDLQLRWSKLARIRMSKEGMSLNDLMKPAKAEAAIWAVLAAANESAATKDLTSEQLVAIVPDFETDEEEIAFSEMVAKVVVKVLEAAKPRGKKQAQRPKSGPLRAAG